MHPLKVLLLLLIPFISILGPFFSLADNVLPCVSPQLHCKTAHIFMACRIPFSQGTLLVVSRLKRVKPPPAPVFRRTDDARPTLPGSFFAHPAYGSRLIISHRMLMGNADDNASRLRTCSSRGWGQPKPFRVHSTHGRLVLGQGDMFPPEHTRTPTQSLFWFLKSVYNFLSTEHCWLHVPQKH